MKKKLVFFGIITICFISYFLITQITNKKVKEIIETEIINIKKEFPNQITDNIIIDYNVSSNLLKRKVNIKNLNVKFDYKNNIESYLKVDNIEILGNHKTSYLNIKIDNILFDNKQIEEISNNSKILSKFENHLKNPINIIYKHKLENKKSISHLFLNIKNIGSLDINIISSIYDPYFRNQNQSSNYISNLSLYKGNIKYTDQGGVTNYINTLDIENISKYDLINKLEQFKTNTDNEDVFINQLINSLILLMVNENGNIEISLDSENPVLIPSLLFLTHTENIIIASYKN